MVATGPGGGGGQVRTGPTTCYTLSQCLGWALWRLPTFNQTKIYNIELGKCEFRQMFQAIF